MRSRVRHEADLEEFPNMGNHLNEIIQKVFTPCKSIDEAYEKANQFDWKRNYNILIPFKDVKNLKESKKIISLKERLEKELKKLEEYIEKTDCKNFKSKLITCPRCDSKINKDYIHNSRCPLCQEDLRSKTTVDTVKRYNANIKKINKEIRAEQEKNSSKAKTKYLLMYVEYVG